MTRAARPGGVGREGYFQPRPRPAGQRGDFIYSWRHARSRRRTARRRALSAPGELRGRIDVGAFYALHVLGAVFPITAGMLLYGWRALGTVAVVLAATGGALGVWRRVGWRGRQLHPAHCLWMALLLSLALPAHLLSRAVKPWDVPAWPIVPAAGVLLVTLTWLLGGLGSGRVHPVLVTYLTLVILFQPLLVPHRVLRADHLFTGDLFRTETVDASVPRTEPWVSDRQPSPTDAQAVYDPRPARAPPDRLHQRT